MLYGRPFKRVYLLHEVYCMPHIYPDINNITHEKLEINKTIPLSATKMLDSEMWEAVYSNTYSNLESFSLPNTRENKVKNNYPQFFDNISARLIVTDSP